MQEWIGKTQHQSDVVTASALARFRATLDSAGPQTAVAPQGFHWCLCLPDAATAELGEDGHPRRGGFLPPVTLPRRMWAASDVTFLAPLRVGAKIERSSTIAAITEKGGSTGTLVFVELDHVTLADGLEAVRERQTIVYRNTAAPLPLPPVRNVDLSGWPWARSLVPTPALLFRYSALTFNSHRIHYDLTYALQKEGYPALVLHGPLTATLLLDLCARSLRGAALRSFAFRAQSAAFVDQPLHLVGRRDHETIELRALGADGRTVMSGTARSP